MSTSGYLMPKGPPKVPTSVVPIRPSNGKTWAPMSVSGEGAFGEVISAELTPVVQRSFPYGDHPDLLYKYSAGTGSVSFADSMAKASTGASIGGTAFLRSARAVRYRPGQGALFRFTALFSPPISGVAQTAGAYGGSENGLHVGYDYADAQTRFGFNRQYGGVRDVHLLELSAGAIGAETFTITLNGTAFPVPITAGTAADNAQEIASYTFAGWVVEASGDHVHFLADNAGPRNGTYSASGTGTAAGTITLKAAGVAVTDEWSYQGEWSHDNLDGTGPSGVTLDPTTGNVYQIRMQYLGFGAIDFGVEDPDTGAFILCHRIGYANANTLPSSTNPTYHIGMAVSAVTQAGDVSVSMASMAGFVEGRKVVTGPLHGVSSSGSVSAATPVLSVRNNEAFVNGVYRVNLNDILPVLVAVSGSGSNKPISVGLSLNAILTDPLWVHYDQSYSPASYDVSATGVSGGDIILSTSFSGIGGNVIQELSDLSIDLAPGDTLTVVVTPTGNPADYVASLSWLEDM